MWASCIVRLKINISSQYIITLMLIFLRSEIRISNLDTRSADLVQNTGTQTHRVSPSTESLRASSSFDPLEH